MNVMKPIPLYYMRGPKPGNLGDILSPVLLKELGVPTVHVGRASVARILVIGSILSFVQAHHMVWGTGAMHQTDRPHRKARYFAVRGPLTREVVLKAGGECPERYGDPALLLPKIYAPPVTPVHELGVVPHYRDKRGLEEAKMLGLPVVWPLNKNPLKVVDQLRQCKAIVSSSLHGIVIAHAYGIPAAWLASDKLNGDGIKFRDHAAVAGVELLPYATIAEAVPVAPSVPIDTVPLLEALEEIKTAWKA